jgi:hypothetical protein
VPSRPVWLAIGAMAAAGAAELGGPAAGGVTAAGGVAACLVGGAAVAERAKQRAGTAPAAAALGAALIAARLALGPAAGGSAGAGTEQRPVPLPDEAGTWRATVVAARTVSGQQLATLRVTEPQVSCAGQMSAYPRLAAGDSIEWTGRFRPLRDSDYDRWLESRGVSARCDATAFAIAGRDTSPMGRLEDLRQESGDALQRVLPEPAGGLAAAILIGLRDRVDRDVAADFTTAGVSHIVASRLEHRRRGATTGALLRPAGGAGLPSRSGRSSPTPRSPAHRLRWSAPPSWPAWPGARGSVVAPGPRPARPGGASCSLAEPATTTPASALPRPRPTCGSASPITGSRLGHLAAGRHRESLGVS